MKQLICFFTAFCLLSCDSKTSNQIRNITQNNPKSEQLIIDALTDPDIKVIPLMKKFSNEYFSLTYRSVYTFTEHGYNPSTGSLNEITIKENDTNLLYITVNQGECDYQFLYNNSLKNYSDSMVSSTPMTPINISGLDGKEFTIRCKYQDINVFIINTKYFTIIFQIFSDNKNSYSALHSTISNFNLLRF